MAWQLIYTSAPRSLEAGRSGFGTVARHRAISPLLVSTIERFSQFSRLPGTDAGRVIYCHRIVPAAGSRFHVLSAIRDAGVDYTGRTNHLAHHVIAEAREIAQLGADGPSPADVLLAIDWATSWNEPPRFLEASEEVALASIPPQSDGSAWRRIAGDPGQARLLASGEASRGAYVIQPAGSDLREVFAESLRLIPERCWQTSFTTSLQPSDEPADFRWVGLEEHSSLRAKCESSGRPILNLAEPGTLDLAEATQPTARAVSNARPAVSSAPASFVEEYPASPNIRSAAVPRDATAPLPRQYPVETGATFSLARGRPLRRWWLWGGITSVIAFGLCVWVFVFKPLYTTYQHRKQVELTLDTKLGIYASTGDGFGKRVEDELKVALAQASTLEAMDVVAELADAAANSLEIARQAKFDEMPRTRPDEVLRARAAAAHVNMPGTLKDLNDCLETIAGLHKRLDELKPEPADYHPDLKLSFGRLNVLRVEAMLEKQSSQLKLAGRDPETFAAIKQKLSQLADQRQAEEIFSLLRNVPVRKDKPDPNKEWFDKALRGLASSPDGSETRRMVKAARQMLDDWEFVDLQKPAKGLTDLEQRLAQRPDWPGWLKERALAKTKLARKENASLAPGSEPGAAPNQMKTSGSFGKLSTPSRLMLYFFPDNKDLSFPLPAGDASVKLFIRMPGQGDQEVIPYGPLGQGAVDERSLGPGGEYFRRRAGKLEAASKPPSPPYRLIVKSDGVEITQVFVGHFPKEESLLENENLELRPDGHILGTVLEFGSTHDGRLVLANSGSIDGTNNKYPLPVNSEGQCELKPAIDAIQKRIAEKNALAEKYLQQAKELSTAAKAPGNVRAKAKQYAEKMLNDEGKRTFSGEQSDAEAVGTFAMALADLWSPEKGESPFVPLHEAGKKLADAQKDQVAARERNEELDKVARKLATNHQDGNKGEGLGLIQSLCQNLKLALGDTKANEAEIEKLDTLAREAARDAGKLGELDILKNSLPAGDYVLFGQINGLEEVRLHTFKLPGP